jgi:protein ImuB
MLWAALLLPSPIPSPSPHVAADLTPSCVEALHGVATWALQFSPRVALFEDAVLVEFEASVRLFGGRRALRDRVVREGAELGVTAVAWAANSLAAHALARAGIENGFRRPLDQILDTLPMAVLTAVQPHAATLQRLGCRTLGDIRRLPRGGVSRRFDKHLLTALDRLYGAQPEAHVWFEVPERFSARLELMSRVETAPALLFGARRLLLQMCGWLAARHSGAAAFTLAWRHDAMRTKDAGMGGELTVRTAAPSRHIEHLCRLLAEHLAKVELKAPVGELRVAAIEVAALDEKSGSLLPDDAPKTEPLVLVLERIAARFGPERVLRPSMTDDHRLEWMQMWQPVAKAVSHHVVDPDPMPQPTWVLPRPMRLVTRGHRPLYRGELHMLIGPHRVEGGWWHRLCPDEGETGHVQRDYWLALSEQAGVLLWVFQERLASDETAWYLHGVFA